MIRAVPTDFWQVGLIPTSITSFLDPMAIKPMKEQVLWMPDPGPWRYLADPFGLQRGGLTHVFAEAYDYRTKHAVIEHHEFGPDLRWRQKDIALACPFHLSYPYIIEEAGEVFMVPESNRMNEIALYRARKFPREWVYETPLLTAVRGADTSVIKFERGWWMFFTLVGPKAQDQRELHVATSDTLTGPWQLHPQNPIVSDRSGARPGGTPFVAADGKLILPVQDCSRTYGGAIRFLRFTELTRQRIKYEHLASAVTGKLISSTHCDGCHTLASCGDLTLIDTKRIVHSWGRYPVDFKRRLLRVGRALGIRGPARGRIA